MTRVFPWILLIVVSAMIIRFPSIGVGILVLAGLAALAHRMGKPYDPGSSESPEYKPEIKTGQARTEQALTLGQWEAGDDGIIEDGAIHTQLDWGQCRIEVGYKDDIPYIVLYTPPRAETEMVFVIRRKGSGLDLAPLVTNTPIASSAIEYRLKTMSLPDTLNTHFESATNRPRLFRELLEFGLADLVAQQPMTERYRLEDITYNGRELVLTIYPAADPSLAPYIADCQALAEPFAVKLAEFLEITPIPSAQH